MPKISMQKMIGGGYNDFWTTQKRYVCVKGSRGSKKSKTTALWIISNLVKHHDANVLCVRKFQITIRDSQYSDLKWAVNQLGLTAHFRFTSNPMEITYTPTGQKVLFRGLDDGLKVTSISVPKGVLCWVWVEEAYEITNEDDFNKLDMSIRGQLPEGLFKRIMLTFNPWSANCWIKARFFDEPDENTFVKTTTYKCNEWLDDSDISIFENMRIRYPKRYRVEGLGEWGITSDLIFEDVEQKEFNVDEIRMLPDTVACFGLDFGYTDPNAFVALIADKKNRIIYVFDEWYKNKATNDMIAESLISMGYGGQRIVCDSAEPKSIHELHAHGLTRVDGAYKGGDARNFGIQLLQNYKFIIHPKCENVWREITNYCWEKNRNGMLTGKPDHEFSHSMDAIRYCTSRVLQGDNFSFD